MRTNCVLNVSNIALINMFSTHIVALHGCRSDSDRLNTMTIQCPSSPLLLLPSGQGRDLHWYLHRHTWVCNVGIHTSTGVSPSWELAHQASLVTCLTSIQILLFQFYLVYKMPMLYVNTAAYQIVVEIEAPVAWSPLHPAQCQGCRNHSAGMGTFLGAHVTQKKVRWWAADM